jgi:hypothetical protein
MVVRMHDRQIKAIGGCISRPEAIRRLVNVGLRANGKCAKTDQNFTRFPSIPRSGLSTVTAALNERTRRSKSTLCEWRPFEN